MAKIDPLVVTLLSYGEPALLRSQGITRPAGAPALNAPSPGPTVSAGAVLWGIASVASSAAGAFHGVKRNHGSIGWGVAWGLAGAFFPVLTPVIAVAQGYAKPLPSSSR